MSQNQVISRLGQRVTKRPRHRKLLKIPIAVDHAGNVEHKTKRITENLSPRYSFKMLRKTLGGQDRFRMECHPNSTISVMDLFSTLRIWGIEGWVPDVICLAEGSQVLTNRGLIPIEKLCDYDRLWDGEKWVCHKGLVYKGVQDVITYAGLTATPDHQVWTRDGWRDFESCSRMGFGIAKTGNRRQNLWLGENYFSDSSSSTIRIQEAREMLCRQKEVCSYCLHSMRGQEMDFIQQFETGLSQGMSELSSTKTVSQPFICSSSKCESPMSESEKQGLATLWSKGNRVPVSFDCRGLSLGYEQFRIARSWTGTRQNRQRWALRIGESQMVDAETELFTYSESYDDCQGLSIPSNQTACPICGYDASTVFPARNESRRNRTEMEFNSPTVWQSPVWDIVGTGPFHRFTVQGLLVHNCIDYADILADPPGRGDVLENIDMTWKLLRRMSQEYHCLVLTATQSNAAAYRDKKLLGRRHFSGRKTKLAHVTGMIGLNVSPEDKAKGITRLNWVVRREGAYNEHQGHVVAGCLAISCPAMKSE